MKTIIIKRPKDKEKYYSDVDIKIFINGSLVEKIGQNEIKEIIINESPFEIKAKLRGGYQSKKLEIDPVNVDEIEIVASISIGLPPLLIFSASMPLFIFAMNREIFDLWKIVAFLLFFATLVAAIIQFFRIRRNGILIFESKEHKV